MAKTKKLSGKELFWYVLCGLIAFTGLVSLVFGIVGEHFPGLYEDNWIAASENSWIKTWSGLGYRYWGIILIVIAAFIVTIALTAFAKEGDRDSERALRRQQRLALNNAVEEKPVEENPEA